LLVIVDCKLLVVELLVIVDCRLLIVVGHC
jgi:hypothetical protein